jgi:hypothetical protein
LKAQGLSPQKQQVGAFLLGEWGFGNCFFFFFEQVNIYWLMEISYVENIYTMEIDEHFKFEHSFCQGTGI